ncbi:MAG: sugar transferase [[Clostridium] symbiosum]
MKKMELLIKRFMDVLFAILSLFILSPLFMIIAILIKSTSKGPVFYKQKRYGKDLEIIYPLKFRSMVVGAENIGAGYYFEGEDDPRITAIGKFIRKTSIDELPQLWNILKGDMSLIGPRPTIDQIHSKFNNEQLGRYRMRPGITGWAQVNGRNNISWSKRAYFDNWYIDHYSILLDIKIFFMTILVVLKKSNINMEQSQQDIDDL